MLHLRVLGGTDLQHTGGEGPRALLAQPKRFAVLAYLALARPRGPQRRDVLLLRFWPESDAEHGRGALRLTLHALRRALGEGVIVGRGDEGVGFVPGTLWCDAVEFERALDEGRPADALELYRGELLAGFHLPAAPEWERWLEPERARLARRAVDAVRRLVDDADARDDVDQAVRWARRGLEVAPDDEAILQRLLVLLDAADERAAALAAYDAFARRRAADRDSEPLPETQAIARAIRQRTPTRLPARLEASSAPRFSPSPPSLAPSAYSADEEPAVATAVLSDDEVESGTAPSAKVGVDVGSRATPVRHLDETRPARIDAPGPRRPKPRVRWWWLVAAALVVAAAAGGLLLRRAALADAALSEDRVAVLPFRVRGAPQASYLGEGLVDLLSTRLNGAGAMHTVDPVALLGYAAREKMTPGDMEDGAALARHFRAGSFVVGDVVEAGGRVQVTASLYGVDGRRRAYAEATAEDERRLFEVVDRLAMGLLAGDGAAPDQRLPRTAALTTSSLPALRSYLTGERWFRAGKFGLAAEAFAEAAEADSTFALALYRLSTALDWAGQGYGSRSPGSVVRQALRFRSRLSPHDRMLLEARDAYWNGSAARAEQMYRSILDSYPTDVEAWHELGEVIFHRGVWMGMPLTRARSAFERALALAPDNESARIHLARIAALEGRAAERDTLVAQVVRRHPSHARALELLSLHAFGSGDAGAQAKVIDRARGIPYDGQWVDAWRTAIYLGDPAAGERLSAAMRDPARPVRARALAHTLAAHMLAAQGRWRAASGSLAAAEALEPDYAVQVRASLALLPGFPLARAQVDSIRAALQRTPAKTPADSTDDAIGNASRYCPVLCRQYVLGALAVRAGDVAAAQRSIRVLEAYRDTSAHRVELARYQAYALRARIAQRGGDSRRALALLEKGWPHRTLPQFSSYETYAHTPERLLRADLLRSLGREREALEWYATVDEDLGAGVAYLAPAHLAQAEILDRLGERRAAAAHYARFVGLWKGADPSSQPIVQRARTRLAQLGGQPSS
jgi:DNA-binding SARP family transcriptional activator/TolB-like protein